MKSLIIPFLCAVILVSVQSDPLPVDPSSTTPTTTTKPTAPQPSHEIPDVVRNLYQFKTFEFEGIGSVSSVSVLDFDYDPYTGYLCAAFKRLKREERVPTIACFDGSKFKANATIIWSAFPTLNDNLRPDQTAFEPPQSLARTKGSPDIEAEQFHDKISLVTPHKQRRYGRTSRQSPPKDEPLVIVEDPDEVPIDEDFSTPFSSGAGHRKPYNFISINKIHFDDCGRLWFGDLGTTSGDGAADTEYRPPTLWAFELATTTEDRRLLHKLYLRYELQANVTVSGLSDFAVDIHGTKCSHFYVYTANALDNAIVVYHHRTRSEYVIYDEALTPVRSEAKHLFQGQEYQFVGGVFSLAMGELNEVGFRDVFFTLGSGSGQYAVNTRTLRRRSDSRYFASLGYRGCGVTTLNHVYDSFTKVIFYMHPESKSVRCWNTNTRLIPENVATVFTNDALSTGWSLKIDQSNNLWFMANDFNFFKGQRLDGASAPLGLTIFRAKVATLIENTICEGDLPKADTIDEEDTFDAFIDGLLQTAVVQELGNLGGATFPGGEENANAPKPGDLQSLNNPVIAAVALTPVAPVAAAAPTAKA